jgi:Cu-Zn family superoxide dismutase
MKHGLSLIGVGLLLTLAPACHGSGTPKAEKLAAPSAKSSGPAYQNSSLAPKPAAGTESTRQKILIDPGSPDSGEVTHAMAVLEPTKDHDVHGTVSFSRLDKGVRVEANLTGLPPGKHAFHIHLYGDCSSDDGKTAGTHFNLMGSSLHPPKDIKRITGNLGELSAGKDGKATFSAVIEHASLDGAYSIIGRSVIVHEKGNDPKSPPIGAAGGRLACGVIGIGPT